MAQLSDRRPPGAGQEPTYAFINIFGLAIGLAACLMLLLYVRYETSYDEWLPNAENIYQFQSHYRDPADRRGSAISR